MKGFWIEFDSAVKVEANNEKEAEEKFYSMLASIWGEDENAPWWAHINTINEETKKGE